MDYMQTLANGRSMTKEMNGCSDQQDAACGSEDNTTGLLHEPAKKCSHHQTTTTFLDLFIIVC